MKWNWAINDYRVKPATYRDSVNNIIKPDDILLVWNTDLRHAVIKVFHGIDEYHLAGKYTVRNNNSIDSSKSNFLKCKLLFKHNENKD